MAEPYDLYDYPQYWRKRKYEHQAEKVALKKLLTKIPKKNNLLDIGGGFGRLAEVYAPIFKNCLLVDPSEELIKIAQNKYKKYINLSFKKGRLPKLPLADNQFDCVLVIRLFHHLSDLKKPIVEIHRVLKPKGYLILEFANKIHGKSVLKSIFSRNFNYLLSHLPENISHQKKIPFFNYHPMHIKSLLLTNGFNEVKTLSVSNFRNPIFKKFIPIKILLFFESLLQPVLSFFNFGPSIFILAQNKKD